MISDVITLLGEIPGLEKTAVRWAEARYNAKVAIATARIGGDHDAAVALVKAAETTKQEQVSAFSAMTGTRLLTLLVLAFATPLVVFVWKVVVWDIVLGLGTTDPIKGQVASWANTVIVSIFGSATAMCQHCRQRFLQQGEMTLRGAGEDGEQAIA
jgi:hypothetical protein